MATSSPFSTFFAKPASLNRFCIVRSGRQGDFDMDLARFDQANDLIRQAIRGTLPLDSLDQQLTDLIWGIHPADDPNVLRLTGPILLLLAEWDQGHRTPESVIDEAQALTRNLTVVWPPTSVTETSASGRNYVETFTIRRPSRVVVGRLPVAGSEISGDG
jgi:hypothetical protein